MMELHSSFDPSAFWLGLLTLLSGAWTGLPPGESDPDLLRVLPEHVVVCAAWSEAGTGEPGAPGIAGFAADPEVRLFTEAVRQELVRLREQSDLDDGQAELREQIERLALALAKRPGCVFVAVDEPIDRFEDAPPHVQPFLRLRAGVAVNLGPDREAILADLRALLRRLPGAQIDAGFENFVWNPELPGLSITARRLGDRLLLGLGPAQADQMAMRLTAPPHPGKSRVELALAELPKERLASLAFVDFKELVTAIPRFIGLQGMVAYNTARAVGLDVLDYGLAATTVQQHRVVLYGRLATTGPLDGVLALGAGETLRPEHFSHVPGDADLLLAGSLSFSRLHLGIRNSLQKLAPFMVPVYEQALKQAEVELGVFIEGGLFQAFGDVWVVHSAPSLGGWTGNGAILSLPVQDPGHAREIYGRLTDVLVHAFGESDGQYRVNEESFLNHTLFVLRRMDGAGAAIPTFCLTDQHLYIAQHPQALKAQLRFVDRGAGPSCADRLRQERSLPEGAVGLIEIDSPALAKGVWARLPELAERKAVEQMYSGNGLFPISRIPSAGAVLPYIAPTRGIITRGQTGGFVMELRNPLSSLPLLLLQAWLTTPTDSGQGGFLGNVLENAPPAEAILGAGPEGAAGQKGAEETPPAARPAAQPAAAGLLRALLPDNIEGAIPQSVFDRIAEDAAKSPEQRQAERLERQKQRRSRKQEAAQPQ